MMDVTDFPSVAYDKSSNHHVTWHYLEATSAPKKFQILTEAYGDKTLSYAHVFEWHKWFSGGRDSVVDDERAGRPKGSNKNGESPEEPFKTLVPELLPAMAATNVGMPTETNYFEGDNVMKN
ncbi:hypothetical protein TNCV_725091 [Trichonephila clavipes]|nr:hypothetical protein TNCV_725091 [Trichonephila clavipes]